MRESFLKLNDRTVVLSGPMTQVTSAIVGILSERGSDVAMVLSDKVREAQRFAENVTDQREVHHHYGRVAAIESDMKDEASCSDAVSRSAEIFGSIDILIDTHLLGLSQQSPNYESLTKRALAMAKASFPYMEGRQKGRIILMTNDFLLKQENGASELQVFVQGLSAKILDRNITANVISCGVTEEYLMEAYKGKKGLKDALEDMKQKHKCVRLIDAIEIASLVTFLASPVSSAICGETIHINSGLEIIG
jgi:NAD(P)-dependent dehydrogenase (short-subunit alcohol dehydrogenase family)